MADEEIQEAWNDKEDTNLPAPEEDAEDHQDDDQREGLQDHVQGQDRMKASVTSLPEFAPAPRTLPANKWQGSQDRPGRRTQALSIRSWCHQQRRALDRVLKGESISML